MKAAVLCTSAAIAMTVAAGAWAESKCKLMQIAEWPVRVAHPWPLVEGSINGHKIGVLLDTGAGVSLIARSAAQKLGLQASSTTSRLRMYGIGGETRVEAAYIDEFKIGDDARKNWVAVVAGELPFPGDVAFVLGRDFFQDLNIEFDLPHNTVRLFDTKDCDGAWLAYWARDAVQVPLESSEKILLPIQVNGTRLMAELDSGATHSIVSLEAGLQMGKTPSTPGVVPGACASGLGRVRAEQW